MKRRTRKNPLATARDLNELEIVADESNPALQRVKVANALGPAVDLVERSGLEPKVSAQIASDMPGALAEAVPPTTTTYLESLVPQVVPDPANPTTHIRWKLGDAESPPMLGHATTWELLHDKPPMIVGHEVDWVPGEEDSSVGLDGEYAINNAEGYFWGPKAVGAWPPPKFLGTGEVSVGFGLPGEYVPQSPIFTTSANLSLSNGTAFLLRWRPEIARGLVSVAFEVALAAGNNDGVDVGVYSVGVVAGVVTMTRIIATGPVLGRLNSTGLKTIALAGDFRPDTTYIVALSAEVTGTAPQLVGRSSSSSAAIASAFGAAFPDALSGSKGACYPLPSTITTPGYTPNPVPLIALREI